MDAPRTWDENWKTEGGSVELMKGKPATLDGAYEKIRVVGKGAFGTAVLYRRRSDSRLVVLKEVNISELSASERQMALNEVEVLSVLHHSNIIRYLGNFEFDGLLVIEMEFADGGTLSQYLSNCGGPLGELQILSLFRQIVAALQYMHQRNILHRDLKTANVFLTKDNIIKVGDFGISKVMNTKSEAHTVLGTPYYISPEMCEGKQYDEKSDMWALGCILYELASRERAFQGSNLPALVNKIMKVAYEPVPSIYSSGLKLLVSDLLQKDPELRPPASVVHSRVNKLYDKIKQRMPNDQQYKSVMYQLSGDGPSFQLKPVKMPPASKITKVAIGNTHIIALTSDKMVYGWGGGERGQLGIETAPDWLHHPVLLQALLNKSVTIVGAGDGFSVFVTDSGMVLTCGDGTKGSLGHGDTTSVHTPQHIEKLLNYDVINLSCGDEHSVCLTRERTIFTWGTQPSGQMFCGPQEVAIPGSLEAMKVCSGPDATAVITTCGRLLVSGNNINNKLGLDKIFFTYHRKIANTEKLRVVASVSGWKVVEASLGRKHTVLLTEDGFVITMGANNDCQLGHNDKGPSLARLMADRVVTMAKSGPTYTVVGTLENALYFWGTRFTQDREVIASSGVSMSTIETQLVPRPQEILMLYASEKQVSEGKVVVLNSVYPLWDSLLLVVDTTASLGTSQQARPPQEGDEQQEPASPVPDWIQSELDEATDEWLGEGWLVSNL